MVSKKRMRIGRNPDGTLDEIFVRRPDYLHIEQMDAGHWWMAFSCEGKLYHVNLTSRGKIAAIVEPA